MKRTSVLMLVVAGCLMWTGCNDEKITDQAQGLALHVESHQGHQPKTLANGSAVHWKDGDKVWLNGNEGTVKIEGPNAKVQEALDFGSNPIYGYYPYSLAPASEAQSDNPTVTLPSSYSVAYDMAGNQDIALPMVGTAPAGAGSITFRHLSAAVLVRLLNDFAHPIYLDSVVVVSDSYQLSGSRSLDLAAADLGLAPLTTGTAAQRRVSIAFERHSVAIAAGAIHEVQVPILPIEASNLDIRVYSHRWIEGMACDAATYTYSRSDGTGALVRNQMATAQIALDTSNPKLTTVERGAFTINGSGGKVYFAKGNLQYSLSSSTWSFMENQYDIGEKTTVGENYSGESRVSLFGWGTNGAALDGRITDPTATSTTAASYGPESGNLNQAQDWGHNPITNGGDTADQWRTLSNIDWNYIFKSRTNCSTVDGKNNALYAPATVAGKTGVILFPDTYKHPSITVSTGTLSSVINSTNSTFSKCVIDQANWKKMEAAGAIFLPTTGQRNGTSYQDSEIGYYYTCSDEATTTAKCVRIVTKSSPNCYYSQSKHKGCAVRLVTNVK